MSNETEPSLGYISLRWMVQEVIEAQCGVLFDMNEVMKLQAKTDPEGIHNQFGESNKKTSSNENCPTSGERPSKGDCPPIEGSPKTTVEGDPALAPIHDQLALKRGWWILEYLPTFPSWQDEDGVWRNLKKLR